MLMYNSFNRLSFNANIKSYNNNNNLRSCIYNSTYNKLNFKNYNFIITYINY